MADFKEDPRVDLPEEGRCTHVKSNEGYGLRCVKEPGHEGLHRAKAIGGDVLWASPLSRRERCGRLIQFGPDPEKMACALDKWHVGPCCASAKELAERVKKCGHLGPFWGAYYCELPAGHAGMHRVTGDFPNGKLEWKTKLEEPDPNGALLKPAKEPAMDKSKPTLYICVGFPGSGKSHWAREHKEDVSNPTTFIVNRDAIREMVHGGRYAYAPSYERTVKDIRTFSVHAALTNGFDVIVDETHITRERRTHTRSLAKGRGNIAYVLFNTMEECLDNRMREPRGMTREKWESVIEGMKKDFEPVAPDEFEGCEVIRVDPLRLESEDREAIADHHLKCWPEFFNAIVRGDKRAELRLNDRDYQEGEVLLLSEWDPDLEEYTKRHFRCRVTHVLKDCPEFGLADGYAILSIRSMPEKG